MHMIPFGLSSALLLALAAGCASPEPPPTARDADGNYATSSTFNSSERKEFMNAMRSGLADFDRRKAELETKAGNLGQSAINELHGHMPGLTQKRTTFVNESARLEASLDKDWPVRRQGTQDAYDGLRVALDDAFAAVLK